MFRVCAGPRLFASVLALSLPLPSVAWASDPDTVAWSPDWRRVNVAEAVATIALTVADTEIDTQIPYPSHADWHGGILFDNWARDVFRGRTLAIQQTASTASDLMYKVGSFVPLVVDDYFATLAVHENADVAVQMLFIDLEAFAVSGLVSLTAEHAVGRARPYTEDCNLRDSSGNLLHQCGTANDARSFYSGHATATATTAGLVCIEHQHLPLFGGGFADLAPCLLMIGVSLTTGVMRLVYDEHWASDVMTGWIVGAASGYLLPAALHYGFGGKRPPGEIVAGDLRALPTLLPYQGGAGAGFVGVF
jgi:membrane-associated phospholipid phosphatase